MVVAYQAVEALKILVEDWDALRNTLVSFDLWKNQQTSIRVGKIRKEDCPSCGTNPTYPYLDAANHTKTAVLCGRETVQIRPPAKMQRNLEELVEKLKAHGKVEQNPYLVSFMVGEHRLAIFADGRVLVHGTKDITEAKSLYHRYLG